MGHPLRGKPRRRHDGSQRHVVSGATFGQYVLYAEFRASVGQGASRRDRGRWDYPSLDSHPVHGMPLLRAGLSEADRHSRVFRAVQCRKAVAQPGLFDSAGLLRDLCGYPWKGFRVYRLPQMRENLSAALADYGLSQAGRGCIRVVAAEPARSSPEQPADKVFGNRGLHGAIFRTFCCVAKEHFLQNNSSVPTIVRHCCESRFLEQLDT